jgi:MFS family permease
MPAPKSALFIVWLVVFIDLLGFGIVLPVMPRLAEPYLDALRVSDAARGAVIGVLFSVFSLMQFVFSPVWGRVSDRIGRRPVLLVSLTGSVVFYALFGYAVTLDSPEWALGLMLAARVGAGVAGASVGTAAAVIADCTTAENRAKGMALIGIAFGVGFTVGPLIAYAGLELFQQQRWGVGALASALSAVALVVAALVLPETRNPEHRAGKEFFSVGRTLEVLRMPAVGPLVLAYFLAIFAFANFEATLALLTGPRPMGAFGFSDRDNFLVFAAIGAVLTVAGGMYRPLVKRRGEVPMLTVGVGLMLVGLGALGFVAYAASVLSQGLELALLRMFYLAIAVAVVGFAFVNPSVSALVSKRAEPGRQGEVQGVNQGCASLGRILGPFLGNVLYQAHPSHVLPYAAAGLALLAVVALLPVASRAAAAPATT